MAESEEAVDLRPLVRRRIIWDVFPHADVPELLKELGFVPGTEEGLALEHHEADVRCNLGYPYFEMISAYANLAADIMVTTIVGTDPDNAEIRARFIDQESRMIGTACCSIVSNLLATGFLKQGAIPVQVPG